MSGSNWKAQTGIASTSGRPSYVMEIYVDDSTEILSRLSLMEDSVKVRLNGNSTYYDLFGTHNKPSGTYTGNGSDTRSITVGGVGNVLLVYQTSIQAWGLVTSKGICTVAGDDNIVGFDDTITFKDGVLKTRGDLNLSGKTYYYQVL
jgi:hypothetical protein